MRLITVGDIHIRAQKPLHRKDKDFVGMIFTKLEEILEIATENDASLIIATGDVFDAPDVSLSVVSRFADLITRYRIPFATIIGNHDIYGLNPETLDRSALGVLHRAKVIDIIGYPDPYKYLPGVPDVNVFPWHAFSEGSVSVLPDTGINILVAHKQIVPASHRAPFEHMEVQRMSEINHDIAVCGDYHCDFYEEMKNCNGRKLVVYNTGALYRESATYQNFSRVPKIGIIDIPYKEDRFFVDVIPLKSARPASEVLEFVERKEKDGFEEGLKQFISNFDLSSAVGPQVPQYKKIMEKLLSSGDMTDGVRKIVVDSVSRAEINNGKHSK